MKFEKITVNKEALHVWLNQHLNMDKYVGIAKVQELYYNSYIASENFEKKIDKAVETHINKDKSINNYFSNIKYPFNFIEEKLDLPFNISTIKQSSNSSVDINNLFILSFIMQLDFEEAKQLLLYYQFNIEENKSDKNNCTYYYYYHNIVNDMNNKYKNVSFSRDEYIDYLSNIINGYNDHLLETDSYINKLYNERIKGKKNIYD